MKKRFYTGGRSPSSSRHYLLLPEERLPQVVQTAEAGGILVVNGPRGVGKTTLARLLAAQLNSDDRFAALVIPCRRWPDSTRATAGIRRHMLWRGLRLPRGQRPPWRPSDGEPGIRPILTDWSRQSDVKTVLCLDNFEALPEESRREILKQVLASRPPDDALLHLLVLLSHQPLYTEIEAARREQSGSRALMPEVSFRSLEQFSAQEVRTLLATHTAATGQTFLPGAAEAVWSLTRAQPERVTALADAVVRRVPRREAISRSDIHEAFARLWPSRAEQPSSGATTYSSSRSLSGQSSGPRERSARATGAPPTPEKNSSGRLYLAMALFVVLLLVSLWFLMTSPSPPEQASSPAPTRMEQIEAISSPEKFEDLCAGMVADPTIFDACRRQLPVYERSYRWIDTRLLLKPGESLRLEHLGLLYGLEEPEGEAARHTLGAILAAECKRERTFKPAAFEDLLEPECRQALPTLTQMGIELDRKWMGVRSVDSDYRK